MAINPKTVSEVTANLEGAEVLVKALARGILANALIMKAINTIFIERS